MTTETLSSADGSSLPELLRRNWWLFLLRGIAAIAFGVLALVWPAISLLTLTFMFGAYAVVDGVSALAAALRVKAAASTRWWLALVGLLGIGAAIATFVWPGLTALTLLFFIAGWMIAAGVMQIVGAIQLRKQIENEWWLILNGILSVVVGAFLLYAPGAGALALVWTIGAFAIAFGVMMVLFAFRIRKH